MTVDGNVFWRYRATPQRSVYETILITLANYLRARENIDHATTFKLTPFREVRCNSFSEIHVVL